jgi:spore germination cell wall hydrolase CwlJ-like protein
MTTLGASIMRPLPRIAAFLSVLFILSNCAQPSQSAPEVETSVKPQVARAASTDVACLAEAVYFEARGTSAKGQQAVAHVVVNRAKDSEFPGTVCGVISDRCQFSYRCDGHSDVLANRSDRANAEQIARKVLTGTPDITSGAMFFHAARVAPGWFNTRPRVGQFGGNVFYR